MDFSHFGADTLGQQADPAGAVAQALLAAGCVQLPAEEPFRLPSGWASPVYIDCRRLISFPALRRQLVARGLRVLQAAGALEGLAAVAGGESSGIALAAWVADALDQLVRTAWHVVHSDPAVARVEHEQLERLAPAQAAVHAGRIAGRRL